jgi:Fuc2NAc and GlcNAc transferase
MLPILSLLPVFVLSFALTACWLALARSFRWFDHPNHRSSHAVPTPNSGGAGFVIAFSLQMTVLYQLQLISSVYLTLAGGGMALALMGFRDDVKALGIGPRLGMHIAMALLAILLIEPLPRIVLPWGELQPTWLRGALLLGGLVWFINLFNFMDGIDALAAMESIFFCLSLALLTLPVANGVTLAALGLAAAVSGFLYFNLPPARLFMGDLGSNYLGYMLAVIGVLAISSGGVNVWTLLVLLGAFIVDATSTLLTRMRSGLVWYHAHRSHAYQCAARRYGNHGTVVIAVSLIIVVWLLPLAWLTTRYETWGLLVVLIAWTPLYLIGKRQRQHEF